MHHGTSILFTLATSLAPLTATPSSWLEFRGPTGKFD
jgi:hypothetical protein